MSNEFANHKDPIDVLFSHMSHPNAEYRHRLLIEWCKNHVREFSVQRFTDIEGEENKRFAEHTERAQLMTLLEGVVTEGAKITESKSEYGSRYTMTVRIIL